MKYLLLILAFAFPITIFSQTATDYQVSLSGIGAIKVDMSKTALEKLINSKITITTINKDDYIIDTIKIIYGHIDLEVAFYNKYISGDNYETSIHSISGRSPLLKTKSGIGIGDDKIKIIKTYETYYLEIFPIFTDEKNTLKSKSQVTLHGDAQPNIIVFDLEDNKVVSFTVSIFEGC